MFMKTKKESKEKYQKDKADKECIEATVNRAETQDKQLEVVLEWCRDVIQVRETYFLEMVRK